MDSIPKNEILTFHQDTLVGIRKEYDLDIPGRMDESINVLIDWLKKQEHFIKKDFDRDYLERLIIFGKGSVERTKTNLDRSCTLRSLLPNLYKSIDFKRDYKDSNILIDGVMPKLTEDHYRTYVLRNVGKRFDNGFTNYFRFAIALAEYLQRYDYCKGFIIVVDYRETNILELIKSLDMVEMNQAFNIITKGFGMRVKGIHILSHSKSVETVVSMLKQIFSKKIGERIQVHNNVESLHKFVDKDILPPELGGNEKSLVEIHDKWINVLSSKEFQEYYQTIKQAVTNENYRPTDKFNEEYMGTAGTFRTLSLD
ncbi:Alpha-tocopherol transfer protein [Papilio xuthus]|uniref:Alpha-tocopherol transfer protein n=1 Tax=Papilio xuthus TaxID=66420 RepID=A0A194PZV1_PAPXU|nr:Alpha-tocopherol transfer protein [Papilio xuthus]